MNKLITCTAILLGALNVSGCALTMAGGGYHYDNGDLVSADGTVRYMGWCALHKNNSHCDQANAAVMTASTDATSVER